jgi:hypothetical protein
LLLTNRKENNKQKVKENRKVKIKKNKKQKEELFIYLQKDE